MLRIFRNPREIIHNKELAISDVENQIIKALRELVIEKKNKFLVLPDIINLMKTLLLKKDHKFNILIQTIEKLSPLYTLKRGYSIAAGRDGKIIRGIGSLVKDDVFDLILSDGRAECSVNSTQEGAVPWIKKSS